MGVTNAFTGWKKSTSGLSPAGTDGSRKKTGFYADYVKKRRKRSFRANLVAVIVTVGIVAASLFWILSFNFYTVTSNSMSPALQGSKIHRDRLLCWKLAYSYRKPKRWEVIVFQAPQSAKNFEIMPGFNTGGESGITVKRVVGMPGERLALAGGDVWTRPLSGGEFVRQTKSDKVQRGMWIGVYREDFSDMRSFDEFLYYWEPSGEGEGSLADGKLRLEPDGVAELRLDYVSLARTGLDGKNITRLPGVPDRYLLEQEVLMSCRNPDCRETFPVRVSYDQIRGRCPVCGTMSYEDSVAYYELRSGLPETGPYSAGLTVAMQGDEKNYRTNTYHFVSDLRLSCEVRLDGPGSSFSIELSGEENRSAMQFGVDAIKLDGEVVGAGIKPGEWTRVEFYSLDGVVRGYVGEDRKQVFDSGRWNVEKPPQVFRGSRSGVAIAASGGVVDVRQLDLDRDIFYYSGREFAWRNHLNAMDENGEADVPAGTFFPLGDNATVSLDGRSWGPVNYSLLRGKAVMIWRPHERAGWIPSP